MGEWDKFSSGSRERGCAREQLPREKLMKPMSCMVPEHSLRAILFQENIYLQACNRQICIPQCNSCNAFP